MIRCFKPIRKENIRRSALHECDWSCQQKDDRCDLRCPPGWTTVPTHFAICRLTELHPFHPARKGSGSLRPFPIYPLYTQAEILSLDKPIADCFLFRPRKSCEKRRKRSHTNVSNTLVTRSSAPPAQTAHVRFHGRKRVHTRLSEKNHTQRRTPKQGAFPSANAERLCAASEIAPSRMTKKSGCTPETCIRFFQYSTVLLSVGQL